MEPKRCKQQSKVVYDRISELPDEIFEDILSCLTMKEAARTGVLSRRWKDMWTYTTGGFDFDFGSKDLISKHQQQRYNFNIWKKEKHDMYMSVVVLVEAEREIYVNKVNKILKAHKGSGVEEFKVEFYLESTHKSDIDSWIEFAVRKGVTNLELKLEPLNVSLPFFNVRKEAYKLSAVKMTRLKSLRLEYVNVTDEVLEYLLMPENCPSLEIVRMMYSKSLVDVKVVVPCLKLKHLELQFNLLLLEMYRYLFGPKSYVSLNSGDQKTRICLREVPNLTDVTFFKNIYTAAVVTENLNQLSIPLYQIEKLNLCSSTTFPQIYDFPVLKNLKHLKLEFEIRGNRSVLLSCSSMMKACPNLHTFSITMNFSGYPGEDREVLYCQDCSVHKNLKVVEFGRFHGKTKDVELATYLLSTSPYVPRKDYS